MALIQEKLDIPGYELVVYGQDSSVGLEAIIAVHNTNLGPACGGTRLYPYEDKEAALKDVLRLSKGMSYKSALAGIGFGGGKSVILANPSKKSPELFRSFGQFVDTFKGKYIAAKDMNVDSSDLLAVKSQTPHVLGIEGEPGSGGDPSPVTARAAFGALKATWKILSGTEDLTGVKVAVQGLGYVGRTYAELIHQAGGKLWVTDIDDRAVEKSLKPLQATSVGLDEIYSVECDIFAPCAVGGILNQDTIERLRCKAVVGCANNQLDTSEDGQRLFKKGILYAPDYAVNSGGIINVFYEFEGYDQAKAFAKADEVHDTIYEILKRSKQEKVSPHLVADALAEERIFGK